MKYWAMILVGAVALAWVLIARTRRRDRHERDDLRAHVRRFGGP